MAPAMRKDRPRVALLGAGKWAEHAHGPGWKRDPRVELAVICDVVAERAAALRSELDVPESSSDWQAVVAREDIDIVDVVTPSKTHFELAWAALETGKHVLCEKPVAYDFRDTLKATALARDKGVKTKLGFTFRYSPGVQYARSLLDEGFVGRPYFFNGYEQNSQWLDPNEPLRQVFPDADPSVLQTSSLEGYGAPIIDIGHWWVGAGLARVVGTMANFVPERRVRGLPGLRRMNIDDGDVFIGEHTNGALTTIQTSFVTVGNYPGVEARIYGEKGAIICRLVEEFGVAETIRVATPDDVEFRELAIPDRFYPKGGHARESWRSLFYANLVKDFIDEILDGGPKNEGGFEDGAWVQETINAVELSLPRKTLGRAPAPEMSWLDRFFEAFYRFRPVDATFIGFHEHDDRLPDASPEGLEAALDETRSLRRELEPDGTALDEEIAAGALEIQAWELESGYLVRGNPSWYTGEAIFGVFSLLLRDFAPLAERLERAEARLAAIPGFLDQGQTNVARAPESWIERAARECQGAIAFLNEGIGHLPIGDSFRERAREAAASFERYRAHLSALEVAPARGCGVTAFELLLRRGHFLDWTAREILDRAQALAAGSKAALVDGAARFGASDFREALAQLEEMHPSREGYYRRFQELWEASRVVASEAGLSSWPDFPVDFVPRPDWCRGAAPYLYFLFYRAPAPLDGLSRLEYLVAPLVPEMTDEESERLLRATNDAVIKANHVVHHAGLGHHLQNWHAARARSRVGQVAAVDGASRIALFCGGTMAEGWACYATDLMAETSFFTELERYAEHHAHLRMAARAIADVKLHTGGMSFADAERFYCETTAMSPAAARAEVTKNTMFPGAAVIYLVGSALIHELKRAHERALGARFELKQFHDAFLSYGSLPVALVARELRRELLV